MISAEIQPSGPQRICLILEGTYPLVSGGVSTWVHQMVAAMPDIEFSIHCIVEQSNNDIARTIDLPPNVTSVTTSGLFDTLDQVPAKPGHGSRQQKAACFDLIRTLIHATALPPRIDAIKRITVMLRDHPGMFTQTDLLESRDAWLLLSEACEIHAPDAPFLLYNSIIRHLATTIWKLFDSALTLPEADVYHCACSGYAGLLGTLGSHLHQVPLLLSESGLYLKERIEDIRRSDWLAPRPDLTAPFDGKLGTAKDIWLGFFQLIDRIARAQAHCVAAPFRDRAHVHVESGDPSGQVAIIPGGTDTARFASIAREKLHAHGPANGRATVGFLGRIVPIKDIKTLLRAARLVLKTHPETRFLLAGPTDKAPEYFEECLALTSRLGISPSVEFPGHMEPDEFLQRTDILCLTSISEGFPFAVLEASAAGVPVVATNVGPCRELLIEPLPGQPTLGPAGFIAEVANPTGIAHALNRLVASAELRFEHGMNGLRRVQSTYRREDSAELYRKLYHDLATSPAQGAPATS